jgi:hypothetical protein
MKEYTLQASASGTTGWLRMDASPNHGNRERYTLVLEISGTLQADVEFA